MIVPRWEWRTFGPDLGEASRLLEAEPPEREQTSDEVYLLSTESDASVKVRDGLLDVKRLEAVDEQGLEQWLPVVKTGVPVAAADVAAVAAIVGVEAPAGSGDWLTLEEVLGDLVGTNDTLRAVEVHKHRRHFTVAGAMVEVSEIEAAGCAAPTVAVEAEDPALVVAALHELGLAGRRNVCMARGLKALVGFGAHRTAVVDVGTNSVKFLIGEIAADRSWTPVVDRAEVTRLGEGVDETGELQPAPVERTLAAIEAMAEEAAAAEASPILAVGTAGLRMASNRDSFVEAVRSRTGLELKVISGEEESRLAYLAVASSLDLGAGSLVVFDTGGGSSQFTFGQAGQVEERFSVDVGAVRFTERFGLDQPVDADRLEAALAAIAADLSRLDGRVAPEAVVGIGGAVTNMAAVRHELAEYAPEVVRGTELDLAEIDRQVELYRTRTADERREIPGLQPRRAEVILAGACIVRTVLAKLGRDSLTVSDRGLRHGVLAEQA